jgi:hypothetical protein
MKNNENKNITIQIIKSKIIFNTPRGEHLILYLVYTLIYLIPLLL